MAITHSMEDYLECIYLIHRSGNLVRAKDLANKLNVKLPSVTEAIQKLAKKKMINYKRYGTITITKKGEKEAKGIYIKHKTLYNFFVNILKVDKITAEEDACKIEHLISNASLNKLARFTGK